MCVSPSYVFVQAGPTYEKVPVACRVCWRCKSNRVNSYIGRCLAEHATSDWSTFITLTYRNDPGSDCRADQAEKYITIRHFQDFVRSLRDTNHRTRYFVAAERGELFDRVHFHALLFGKGKPLEVALNQRDWIPSWPHGHVYAESLNEKSARYAAKYLEIDGIEGWFSLSKKPPLGFEWFLRRAEDHIRLGVMPSSFHYRPPGGNKDHPYLLTGATKAWFVSAVWAGMKHTRQGSTHDLNEWVRNAIEKDDAKRFKRVCEAMPASQAFAAMKERLDHERPSMLSVERSLNQAYMLREYIDPERTLSNGKTVSQNFSDELRGRPSQARIRSQQADPSGSSPREEPSGRPNGGGNGRLSGFRTRRPAPAPKTAKPYALRGPSPTSGGTDEDQTRNPSAR